jgi:uncharacterized membrane protein
MKSERMKRGLRTSLFVVDRLKEKEIRKFFVIFYGVGVLGMVLPLTYPLFVVLIPFALLLSVGALMLFHSGAIDRKTVLCFGTIYLVGFVVEAIGVRTGMIFGTYRYGSGLGIKLFDTPLLIGINWLFMVYSSAAIVEKWRLPRLLKIAAAASLMVVYDLVLEQSAPRLDMWHWQQEVIPLQNYGAWFVLSLLFQGLLPLWGVRIHNRLALLIMGCQILFFLLLFVLFQWMP